MPPERSYLPSSFSVRVPAILRASADAQIFPPIPSEIVKVNVKDGEFVTEGQLLFQMRSPQLEKESDLSKQKVEALTLRLSRRLDDQEDRSSSIVLEQELVAEQDSSGDTKRKRPSFALCPPSTALSLTFRPAFTLVVLRILGTLSQPFEICPAPLLRVIWPKTTFGVSNKGEKADLSPKTRLYGPQTCN